MGTTGRGNGALLVLGLTVGLAAHAAIHHATGLRPFDALAAVDAKVEALIDSFARAAQGGPYILPFTPVVDGSLSPGGRGD